MLVLGRTTKQIEETLWRKISSYCDADEYTLYRSGGAIQKAVHKKTRNTIIFLSHHNPKEAQEKAQSFTAHYVWLDEMPGSHKLVEELHRRIMAFQGYFLATFTPKVVNAAIRKLVDAASLPLAKKYRLKALDNPAYTEQDKEFLLASIASFSDSYQQTILEGEWATGDQAVYFFDPEQMCAAPEGYSPAWRHVEASDPATQSKFGFTLWAEDPSTATWYCIKAEYIEGIYVPSDIVEEVKRRTDGYNIVRRIADSHEGWYINQASKAGMTYVIPHAKTSRKAALIKGLQAALSGRIKIAPWCADLVEEFISCQWSERAADKIVNASSFHLLDSAQYFVDCMPKAEPGFQARTWEHMLREGNKQRKVAEAQAKTAHKVASGGKRPVRIQRRGMWGRKR